MAEDLFSDDYLLTLSNDRLAALLGDGKVSVDQIRRVADLRPQPGTREHTRSAGAGHTAEAGSAHYKKMAIQPIEYIEANELGFHEGNVVKYVTRYAAVDGLKDLEKAEWYVQRLIEKWKKEHST